MNVGVSHGWCTARWIEALGLLAAGAVFAQAQHVRLRVTNDADDEPVPKALVMLLNDRALWRTDTAGIIVLTVQHPGPNVFTIRRIGFNPITTTLDVPERDTLKVHVIMSPAAQRLDTVSVSARAAEAERISAFDQRRLHNVGGHFITMADIEQRKPFETLDLFRTMLGLRVIRPTHGDPIILSTRGGVAAGGDCRPRIGLDGAVFGQDFDVNDISPRDIYGIEIYNGAATIPGQYLSATAGGACGLIMIWTFSGAQQSHGRPG